MQCTGLYGKSKMYMMYCTHVYIAFFNKGKSSLNSKFALKEAENSDKQIGKSVNQITQTER